MGFVGAHRQLKQQHVQCRGDRRQDANAKIIGQRELAGLAIAIESADEQAIGERDELKQHGGPDQRQAIAHVFESERAPRVARAGVGVPQGAPRIDQRAGDAQADAGHGDLGRGEPPRAADRQRESEHVLDEGDARIGAVVKARAGQRGAIVIGAIGDRGRRRHDQQAGRQPKVQSGKSECDSGDADDHAERRETGVERGAHLRPLLARARGIEAHGGEPDPVEGAGIDDHRRRRGDRETTEFRRSEELGDEQPNQKVEQRVQGEGKPDGHRSDPVRGAAAVQLRWSGNGLC